MLCANAFAQSIQFPPQPITGVFISTQVPPTIAAGVWNPVNVTTLGLPSGTIGVSLSGFLIITNGNTTGTSDLTIALRPFGSNVSCGNYNGQTIAPNPPAGNGSRTNMSYWVGIVNDKFEYCWQRGIPGTTFPNGVLQPWPVDPAFAINLDIDAWVQ